MTSPFHSLTLKVYPLTDEVFVNGIKFTSPEQLWTHLFQSTLSFAPGKNSPQIGDLAFEQHDPTPPEVKEYLLKHGRFKAPMNASGMDKAIPILSLEDF